MQLNKSDIQAHFAQMFLEQAEQHAAVMNFGDWSKAFAIAFGSAMATFGIKEHQAPLVCNWLGEASLEIYQLANTKLHKLTIQ